MKLGFLTSEFPHPKFGRTGGIGTSIYNLATAYVSLGHEVFVFIHDQNYEPFEFEGIQIIPVPKAPKKFFLNWYFKKKSIQKFINEWIKKNGLDILEVADWTGLTSFMKINTKVVMKLHGSDSYFCKLENRPQKKKNFILEKKAFKSADAVIGVSDFVLNETKKIFGSLTVPGTVIYNGIDLEKFKITSSKKDDSTIVLYFGTLIRKKGCLEIPFIFNELVKIVPTAKLVLVGTDAPDIVSDTDSTWHLMIEKFSDEALNKVEYIGKVPYDQMRDLIETASVCLFPSYAEAFPVSWLEAMALQKPIVASNIGWGPESIIHNESGYLVYPSDHQDYANKISEILKDNKLAKTIGDQAYLRVSTLFSKEKIAHDHISFYKSIL